MQSALNRNNRHSADANDGLYCIENSYLNVVIASKGAELQSIIHKDFGIEYMWSGDPEFWGKKSPVLFPIVGGLKQNSYRFNGNTYHLSRHGFARDNAFSVTAQTEEAITFSLVSDACALKQYPFHFRFSIRYTLSENRLHVTYLVENTGMGKMFFSVGGHPAFKVPLTDNTNFEDYYLLFDAKENAGRWPLSAEGMIESFTTPALNDTDKLPLKKSLFYEDAFVFKNLASRSISILSDTTRHGIKVSFDGFPYMGIWNAKDADFVCIEPWCGIADSVAATGDLEEKEGINSLEPGAVFERTWTTDLF